MLAVDWIIILLLALFLLRGFSRGFIQELLSLVTWVSLALLIILFRQPLAAWLPLESIIVSQTGQEVVAALILLVLGLILSSLVRSLVSMIKLPMFKGVDRVLGAVAGAAKGAVLIMLLLLLGLQSPLISKAEWWQHSLLIPEFLKFEEQTKQLGGAVVATAL